MMRWLPVLALLAACEEAPPQPAAGLVLADAETGRRIARDRGCAACHSLPGIARPHGRTGPALEDFAYRGYIAGTLPNTPRNLVRWLRDPPAVAPQTAMPDLGLTVEEATQIAAFLLTPR
jgi:cytochrome c2